MKKLISTTIVITFVNMFIVTVLGIGVFNTVFPTKTLEHLLISFFSIKGIVITYGLFTLFGLATTLLLHLINKE